MTGVRTRRHLAIAPAFIRATEIQRALTARGGF